MGGTRIGGGTRSLFVALLVVTAVVGVGVGAVSTSLDDDGVGVVAELEAGTDPFAADTDGDGLEDARELSGPTDATVADTDEDGIADDREVAGETNATVADTDGDGLRDGEETQTYGSDPTSPHSDDDGLDDGREVALGIDPAAEDTDGDRLRDDWELANETDDGVALPDADPAEMDLYVVVGVADGVSGLRNYSALEREFAEMPVENPDGTTGVDLHVVETRQLGEEVRLEDRSRAGTDTSGLDRIERQHARPLLGERKDVYRALLFIDFYQPMGLAIGWGEAPGDFSVVNGRFEEDVRRAIAVHELLHNVFGVLETDRRCPDDPVHYCGEGWLNGSMSDSDMFLPAPLAEELEREGFEPTTGG
jgi:hypothetical protein